MPLVLELPGEIENRLRAIANGRGESLEAFALESLWRLAAQAPTDAAKRRAAVDAAYGSLAHLPLGFDFLDEKHADVARENV